MVNVGIKLYDNTIHLVGDIASASGAETTITTIVDYQKKAEVEILICKPEYNDSYCSIGTLLIQNLPTAKAGEPRITLKFLMNADYSLSIYVMSKGILRKQVKIPESNWETSFEKDEYKVKEMPFTGNLFTIDLSVTETEKPGENIPGKKDKGEEKINVTKGRDIIIPMLIIASLIILVFCAVYFFLVLRPWDSIKKNQPEPTQPAATEENPVLDHVSPLSTEQEISIDTATAEPEEKESVTIDLNEINNELKSIGPVYFAPNSSKIRDTAELKKYDRISSSIIDYKGNILLIINGHTAKAGSEGERQDLSLERALAVQKELITRGAITEETCRIEGLGSEKPATPDPQKGHLNRRVELRAELNK